MSKFPLIFGLKQMFDLIKDLMHKLLTADDS